MKRMLLNLIAVPALLAITATSAGWSPPMGPSPKPQSGTIQLPDPFGSTAQPSSTGTLAIRAIQGTPDGPGIGSTKVEIHLYGQQGLVQTIEQMLDGNGVVIVEDIPLGDGVQPVVVVHHAGVTYQRVGELMDPNHPTQTINVTCYELTEQTPAWTVSMRHVMIDATEGGLRVVEILTVQNPDDRTWRGVRDPAFAAVDKRVTTRFDLPDGAADVQLGKGFHDWCCTTKTDEGLVNHVPLMPSGAEMTFSYMVPASGGQATVDIIAPAPTDHLMIMVPKTLNLAGYESLEVGGEQEMNGTPVRYLLSSGLANGQRASVTIDGLPDDGAVLASADSVGASRNLTKVIAGVGGGLIILAAFVILLTRPADRKAPSEA